MENATRRPRRRKTAILTAAVFLTLTLFVNARASAFSMPLFVSAESPSSQSEEESPSSSSEEETEDSNGDAHARKKRGSMPLSAAVIFAGVLLMSKASSVQANRRIRREQEERRRKRGR